VLKKAVLDEQARNNELKDVVKKHEQKIRKHDQEMESVTFRNEQLTKRISVLQQELQVNSHVKKGKNKSTENILQSDTSVLDEELQKKILENAQLVSSVSIIFILKKYSCLNNFHWIFRWQIKSMN
jgi:protein phosphatase 1 regulatory subunit 21